MALFEKQGLHPRGDLGQNFLIDLNLLESIVAEADLGPDDVVLEIGAGTGGMTTFLAAAAGAVVSVEYDPNMYRLAHEATSHLPDMVLLNCDALKNKNLLNPLVTDAVAQQLAVAPGRRLKLVANLPTGIVETAVRFVAVFFVACAAFPACKPTRCSHQHHSAPLNGV